MPVRLNQATALDTFIIEHRELLYRHLFFFLLSYQNYPPMPEYHLVYPLYASSLRQSSDVLDRFQIRRRAYSYKHSGNQIAWPK